MKLAIVSHLYPNELNPYLGKFILDQINLLNQIKQTDTNLLIPTPFSIPFTERWRNNHASLIDSATRQERVYYLSFPKKKWPLMIRSSLSTHLLDSLKNNPERYDLIHLHWLYPDGMAIPALRKQGYKTVLTIHGSDWYKNIGNKKLMNVLEETLDMVQLILCSGPKLKQDIEEVYPRFTEKLKVIYNFVDSSKYIIPNEDQKINAKTALNWDPDRKHILTVANIRPEKGVDILLEAMKNKNSGKMPAEIHIVGQMDSSNYAANIRNLTEQSEYEHIHLHTPVHPEKLKEYYHAADAFVLPSRKEGFNVSLLEATACGLPVVCSDVGGNSELITKDTGIMVEKDNPIELRKAIYQLFDSLASFDSNEIRDRTISRFGEKTYANRLIDIYSSVTD